MSLWAWIVYSFSYLTTVIKAPLSLTIWQHTYSLNVVLVVQETADTFGVLCLGLLFLSSQIFARNFMLSVFTLKTPNSDQTSSDSSVVAKTATQNNVKELTLLSTSLVHFSTLLSPKLNKLKSKLK